MGKRCLLIFILFSFMGLLCQAQGFDDLKKAKTVPLNKKLQALVNQNDAKGLGKLLQSKPEYKEEGSAIGHNDKGAPLVIPLFYDVVDKTLSGTASLELCRVCFAADCDVYTVYNGKTLIYRMMDYFATTPSQKTEVGMEVLRLLFSQKNFDINRRYRSLPPPLSYLLSENYKFLGNKYSKDYLSTELIRLLLDNGARLNTYDENGASLLLLANSTDNVYLQDYLVDHGVNINKAADAEGNNAFYAAIADNNVHLLEKIVKKYNIRITTPTVKDWSSKVSPEMFEYLIGQCAENANSYDELVEFRSHFSSKKDYIKDKYESLARKEVSQVDNYDAIMRCKKRYPDLTKITEPRFKEIATREINATTNIVDLKLCEKRYPDFRSLTDSKKAVLYSTDVKNLEKSYSHAKDLVARSSFSYQISMSDIATSFANNYQNYYDPDDQLPLAKDLSRFYSALSASNQGYRYSYHQLPNPGLSKNEMKSDQDRLSSAYSSLSNCGHGLSSKEMLSSIYFQLQAAKESANKSIREYRDYCEALSKNIKVEKNDLPSGDLSKGLFDTYHSRRHNGEIRISWRISGHYYSILVTYNELYYYTGSLFSEGDYRFEGYIITGLYSELSLSEYDMGKRGYYVNDKYQSPSAVEAGIIEKIVKYYYSFL